MSTLYKDRLAETTKQRKKLAVGKLIALLDVSIRVKDASSGHLSNKTIAQHVNYYSDQFFY